MHFIARCAEPVTDEYTRQSFEMLINSLAPKCINATVIYTLLLFFSLSFTDYFKKDEYGQTPLHICVKKCYLTMLPLLLQLGADCFIIDSSGKNVLHHITCNGSAKVIVPLIIF